VGLVLSLAMPALKAFRRQFAVGSDDLVFPAVLGALVRVGIGLGVVFAVDCAPLVRAAVIVSVGLGIMVHITVAVASSRGNLAETDERAAVGPLLKVVAGTSVLEIVMSVFSASYLLAMDLERECEEEDVTWSIVLYVALMLLASAFFFCGCLLVSNTRQSYTYSPIYSAVNDTTSTEDFDLETESYDEEIYEMSQTRFDWERRCRRVCRCFQFATCNVFGSSYTQVTNETWRDVAQVMARAFKGMDVVPSDLVAALCLLRAEQRSREEDLIKKIKRTRVDELDDRNPPREFVPGSVSEWLWAEEDLNVRERTRMRLRFISEHHIAIDGSAKEVLCEANHFAPYMLAIYGKLLFTYMNLITGPCKLLLGTFRRRNRSLRPRSFSENIHEDDCCAFNFSALTTSTAHRQEPVFVFASFRNDPHVIPYTIGIDEETQTVVVAVRGTLSAVDMIVDAVMTPRPLVEAAEKWSFQKFVDEKSAAHGGMLQTAMNLRQDIEDRRILQDLLRGSENNQHSSNLPDCRGYNLKCVGHSLGSGVASILSLLLKGAFPEVTCLAYSPPGCVFDFTLAERVEWISAVFLDADFIPHSSWRSLMKLRGQMLDMLRRAKVRKATAIRSLVTNTHVDDLLYPEDAVPNTFARQQLELRIKALQRQALNAGDFLNRTPLFAPGRLLHLMRLEVKQPGFLCNTTRDEYLPVWVNDRRSLQDFALTSSTRMALDHFPDVIARVIDQVASEFAGVDSAVPGASDIHVV